MAEPKSSRIPYGAGSIDLKKKALEVTQQVAPVVNNELNAITKDESPEKVADAQVAVQAWAPAFQQKIAAASSDDEAAQIVDQEKQLLQERAAIEKRGLSTGERIAMAILGAAPLVAAAASPRSNFYQAASGADQIRRGMIDANVNQNDRDVAQKDVELDRLDKRRALLNKEKELRDRNAFEISRDKTKHGYDVALKRMDMEAAVGKEQAKYNKDKIKDINYIVKEANNNPLAKDSAKALATYSQFYDVIDNADGFSDFMSSYAAGKLGDPSTGIRDAERTDLMKAGGFLETLKKTPQQFMKGSKFTPESRAMFKRAMDDAARIHRKYLTEGVRNSIQARMALNPALANDPDLNPDKILEATNFNPKNVLGKKAAAAVQAQDEEAKRQRLMELRAKRGY